MCKKAQAVSFNQKMLRYVLILLGVVVVIITKNRNKIKRYFRFKQLLSKLPRAAGGHFLFGHTLTFLGLSPEEIFTKVRQWVKASPPFSVINVPFFSILLEQSAEETEVLIGHMKNLNKGPVYHFLHRWLGQGLLTATSKSWQHRRKILTPAFHFSILLQFVNIFNRETCNFVDLLENNHLNDPVNIEPLISDYTLATMGETSMGTKVDIESKEGALYKKAIHELGGLMSKRFVLPWLWVDKVFDLTSLRKAEQTHLEVLHKFTLDIIKKRSRNFETFNEMFDDATLIKRKVPLLDILLNAKIKDGSIDDNGIRNEVDTFMFEGHDTTAMCLNFTTMLLACHADIQEQIYQEIVNVLGPDLSKQPTLADLQELALLERCIKESLRLYPPVPLIGRSTSEEMPTKYGTVPKNVPVYVSIFDLHRNPDIWPNPDIFDPSRHLPENCRDRHPYAFIPFSAGPRNCIGQRFAMLEIKSFFCGLLRKFVLEPVDTPETVILIQDIILRSRDGIKIKFRLRK